LLASARCDRFPPTQQPLPFLPLSRTALAFVPLLPSFDQTDTDPKGKRPKRDEQDDHGRFVLTVGRRVTRLLAADDARRKRGSSYGHGHRGERPS
jgi:hypothetical protein